MSLQSQSRHKGGIKGSRILAESGACLSGASPYRANQWPPHFPVPTLHQLPDIQTFAK
jgi:hypothetical protein